MITAAVKNQAKNDMLIVEKNKIIFALKEKIKIAKEQIEILKENGGVMPEGTEL